MRGNKTKTPGASSRDARGRSPGGRAPRSDEAAELPFVVYVLWGIQRIPWRRFKTRKEAEALAREARKNACWAIVEGPV